MKNTIITDHTLIIDELEKRIKFHNWNSILPFLPKGSFLVGGYIRDITVSYTHLRAHETVLDLVCRLLLEKKKREKTEKEKQIYYQSMSHTKNLVIDNENNIVHKEGTPISKWNDNEYMQLQYLTKIRIEIFKEMQRKEREDAEKDISEPPDWS